MKKIFLLFSISIWINFLYAQIFTQEVVKPIATPSALVKAKSILLANPVLIGLPTKSGNAEYIRDQGSRGSCTMFAATAALEHYLYKEGFGNIDISEEQMNLLSKTFWLHPDYETQVKPFTANITENQLGITQGGSQIPIMADGMYVCTENNLPYQSSVSYPPNVTSENFWNNQLAINSINFAPKNYTSRVLKSDYYRAVSYKKLQRGNNPAEIENALTAGNVVVWEADIKGDITTPIWDAKATDTNSVGGHAMLIVGFDKTDADAAKHFFWVKNSWGPTQHQYGLTKISYNYIINCGLGALYITGVEKRYWPQIQFMGRWVSSGYGIKNKLMDLYHLPGIIKSGFEYFNFSGQKDYRFGTIYELNAANKFEANSKAYRVNGQYDAVKNTIEIFYKESNPNFNYNVLDKTGAKKFTFCPVSYGDKLAGFEHIDNGLVKPQFLSRFGGLTHRNGNFQSNISLAGNYFLEIADSRFRVKIITKDSLLNSEIEITDETSRVTQKAAIIFAPEMQQRVISATARANPAAAARMQLNGVIFNLKFPALPLSFKNENRVFANNEINFYQLENTGVLIGISSLGMGAILTKL